MTDSEAGSTPAPMEGHGAYNRSSRVQAAGLAAAIPLLREAAEVVPLAPAPEPIVIADYGCSEGHNSLIPMREAIAALRQRIGAPPGLQRHLAKRDPPCEASPGEAGQRLGVGVLQELAGRHTLASFLHETLAKATQAKAEERRCVSWLS